MSAVAYDAGAVVSLAIAAFGDPNRNLSKRRDLRFGRRGSVSLDPAAGVWFDHEAGQGGGVRELAKLAGCPASRLAFAAEDPEEADRRRHQEAKALRRRKALAARFWRSGVAIEGTLAETYRRRARAIRAPLDSSDLAFLADAPVSPMRPGSVTCPAMVARVQDAAGRGVGVHATLLRPDGLGKADLPRQRWMIGEIAGAHVRLIAGDRLVVGEGIESSLSGWMALDDPAAGCIAALSAGGLAALQWPPSTRELIIALDHDEPGERAGEILARRAHASGLQVHLFRPPPGFGDWNDWAREGRAAA